MRVTGTGRPGGGIRAASLALIALPMATGAAPVSPAPIPAPPINAAPIPAAPINAAALDAGPAAIWRDVASVGVTCLIHTPRGVDTGALTAQLCASVRAHAAAGAPVPVVTAAPGGAALAAGRVTLLVQGGVSDVRGAPVLALSLRAFRNDAEAGQLFAAAPRAIAPGDAAALDRAVRALLADTLPWQATRPRGARRIPG